MKEASQAWVTVMNHPTSLKQKDWEAAGHPDLQTYIQSIFNEGKENMKKSGRWDERKVNARPYVRFIDMKSEQRQAFLTEGAFIAFCSNLEANVKKSLFMQKMIQLSNDGEVEPNPAEDESS